MFLLFVCLSFGEGGVVRGGGGDLISNFNHGDDECY